MDVDDQTVLDQLKTQLDSYRHDQQQQQLSAQALFHQENGSNHHRDGIRVVVDTNFLLTHLRFLSDLMPLLPQAMLTVQLIIPWAVLEELDVLKVFMANIQVKYFIYLPILSPYSLPLRRHKRTLVDMRVMLCGFCILVYKIRDTNRS